MPKSIKKLYNAWGQKMKQILNEQKGVTLIALVITIIVLLILAGVTIATLTGDNGIFRLDNNNQFKHYSGEKSIAWNTVSNMCEDKQGNLYMGSLKKGLFRYNDKIDTFVPITYTPNPNLPIKILYPEEENQILIGTDGSGMKVYDIQEQKIKEANFNITTFDLTKAKIHSILKDKMGNIWLGFFQKGVMIIPAITNEFKYLGYKSSRHNVIGSNCVMSVHKDHTGTLWVGTDNDGIYAVTPDKTPKVHFSPTDNTHSVPATIMSIFEDSNHNMWIGSYLNGMAKLDTKTGRCEYLKLVDETSNLMENVYCFAEDNNKTLWIGTMGGGLYQMNINTKEIVRCPTTTTSNTDWTKVNMLHNSWINCLLHTAEDKLYIGTYDGLGCLDIKTMDFVSPMKNRRILYGDVIYALHEGKDGNIWIGTSKGLKRLNPRTVEVQEYTTKDGLPSNYICAIKEDANGYLWISTNYGISRFNPQNQSFINFYASDGLQSNEFSKGAAFADKQGELIFGGTNGITYFNPTEITTPDKKPEIRITDFYIHDKKVKKGMKSGNRDIVNTAVMDADHFQLSYKDNSFSIEFSAMEFFSPERITYTYSINNSNWISLQQGINRVSFSNLNPGSYTFQVKAKDNDSYSDIKEFSITIHPAWYASGWAKFIYGVLLIVIIYGIVIQIRHRYRARQEILEHIHAEQINEAKLQFFINISHEIRTPMSLIISPLQKLIATDKDNERQKNYHTIYRNAERILRLVNQLMDIRKIDKGQMSLKFQEVDIVGFIRDLYYTFEYQANARHITLSFQPETEKLKAWIDPKNFDKIILNIISNAFKFTPENGEINIYLRIGEDINASQSLKHYFEIIVEDSGIGINPEEMGRIFERFYQVKEEEDKIGSGIGLHLVKEYVELHSGKIEVESEVNKGSLFTVYLPVRTDVEVDTELPKEENTFIGDELNPDVESDQDLQTDKEYTILLVEDNKEFRHYMFELLSKKYNVLEAGDGEEGERIATTKFPDLIISDIMMPKVDGLELCKRIKSNIQVSHIPVILLTARSTDESKLFGYESGADEYISKPFNLDILLLRIQKLINEEKARQRSFSQGININPGEVTITSIDEQFIEKVCALIQKNIDNPEYSVEKLSADVGMERTVLYRKLNAIAGQTPSDFIRSIRLKHAAQLLNKGYQVGEVADMVGFNTPKYFTKYFKQAFGVTPSQYKTNMTGES